MADDDALWYKDAVIYELHVKAFCDSDGDGIGDFQGLIKKLDYLQDLGVTALWLLPFYPSPAKDDGYDISDHKGIHPAVGTLRDLRAFVREAHKRGLKVITELVLNHTSLQHSWFQRSRREKPGSQWRSFYVWSDSLEKYKDTRVIFKDFESSNWEWDTIAKAYYWHRFYKEEPDLNYDSPHVRDEMFKVADFWLELGVDGFRLDSVPYLFEREGTDCENLPETHAFVRDLRHRIQDGFKQRVLIAEANQWPEDAVSYFGQGNECHMAFHFPLMPRLFMSLQTEDNFPIVEIFQHTPAIPETCQWALFLRNHDELTLEMVTDEERDYLYKTYAQDPQTRVNLGIRRRLAPLLGNDRRKIELMNVLLFSLPGAPVIYYGDEVGMGDNLSLGDRKSVRTPMQWSPDRNAGFSQAHPQKTYLPLIIDPEYDYETVNVETQQNKPNSLLRWMKSLIAARRRFKAFSRGSLEFLQVENRKVIAFIRRYENEQVLVVANLSHLPQFARLDLPSFKGTVLVDLFGGTIFPPVEDQPYMISLGPYGYYWFSLEQTVSAMVTPAEDSQVPLITVSGSWEKILAGRQRATLEASLPHHFKRQPWFRGRLRTIQSAQIVDTVPIKHDTRLSHFVLVRVEYKEGDPETYAFPLVLLPLEQQPAGQDRPGVFARVQINGGKMNHGGILCDALHDKEAASNLLEVIGRNRRVRANQAEIVFDSFPAFRKALDTNDSLEPSIMKAEQSNTSIVYGNQFVLKFYRRLEEGPNPDLEMGRFLTNAEFSHSPPVAGSIEYHRRNGPPITLAILRGYIPHVGDGWSYTLDALTAYLKTVQARAGSLQPRVITDRPLLALCEEEIPLVANELIGRYLEAAQLLGRRTAELHTALSQDSNDSNFAPEPFTDFYRGGLYYAMLAIADQTLQTLRQRLRTLPITSQDDAREVLSLADKIRVSFRPLFQRKITGMRIRCHGDYHLEHVLYTGEDFVIIDFQGDTARSFGERRGKRSPLRDVASMLRSFHYASIAALEDQVAQGKLRTDDQLLLLPWLKFWRTWVSVAFLKSYLKTAEGSAFLPKTRDDIEVMLHVYLLERALYELAYELENRPDRVKVPLQGVLEILH